MDFEIDLDGLYKTYQSLLPMEEVDEARLWQKFRLDWNYNSNRIEGNTLTYGETEALLVIGTEPKRLAKDIREMKAHDLGIEYLRNMTLEDRAISEADIRALNQIILKENFFIETETAEGNITRKEVVPGTYKTLQNHVRLRGGGIHKFAEPNDVPARMEYTVQSIRTYLAKEHVSMPRFLAELHHDFIQTHPFDDGNGRVVRMLLNYVCLKFDWPPIIIKDKNKKDYLAALERADTGDLSGLEAMMRDELIWSLQKSIAAARGEDPEDIDKEIDMFVRETSKNLELLQFNETSVQEIISNVYTRCVEDFSQKIFPFNRLFDSIDEINWLELEMSKFTPVINEPGEASIIKNKWVFRRLNLSQRKNIFVLYLTVTFRMNAFEILSRIQLEEDGQMPSKHWREALHDGHKGKSLFHPTIFEKSRYNDNFVREDFSKFSSETFRKIMNLIESMKTTGSNS